MNISRLRCLSEIHQTARRKLQFQSNETHFCFCRTHFSASALTLPIAWTTASRTSTASHRRSGTVSLYSAAGLALLPGDLLSPLSADKLSGDELRKLFLYSLFYIFLNTFFFSTALTFHTVHPYNYVFTV